METHPQPRKPYPTDVTDEEWAFVAPYLTLMREDAPQRDHPLREVFNGLRWLVRTGAPWRMLPHDLPPWYAVYQQTQRWLAAGGSRPSSTTCAGCCEKCRGARRRRRR
jgi:transposase